MKNILLVFILYLRKISVHCTVRVQKPLDPARPVARAVLSNVCQRRLTHLRSLALHRYPMKSHSLIIIMSTSPTSPYPIVTINHH